MLSNLSNLIEVAESINENFPDLSQDPGSIQYEWIQKLEKIISEELSTLDDPIKFLKEIGLTQNRITYYSIF